MRQSYSGGYEDVEALRLQFEEFRNRHEKRTRFPEELWRAAAELAGKCGINTVARTVRLDANSLKKWMVQDAGAQATRQKDVERANKPAFVEFLAPTPGAAGNCVLEVESPKGGKLRLEWKGVSSTELTQLIRAFAGQ
jgi:hypothetical protein